EEGEEGGGVGGGGGGGGAGEAHPPGLDVGEAAHIVVDGSVAGERQRVHGEVAPLGVALPVAAEGHGGMAAERLDVFAQGGDFERPPGGDDGHGAVLDAGGHGLETCRLDPADHFERD